MNVLDKAKTLTDGDRQKAYGHPLENWRCTAAIFTAILQRAGYDITVDAKLAQVLMIGVKLARLAGDPTHYDTLVDIAGYARTIEMTQDAQLSIFEKVKKDTSNFSAAWYEAIEPKG